MKLKCLLGLHNIDYQKFLGEYFYFCTNCKYVSLLVEHPYKKGDFKIVRVDKMEEFKELVYEIQIQNLYDDKRRAR